MAKVASSNAINAAGVRRSIASSAIHNPNQGKRCIEMMSQTIPRQVRKKTSPMWPRTSTAPHFQSAPAVNATLAEYQTGTAHLNNGFSRNDRTTKPRKGDASTSGINEGRPLYCNKNFCVLRGL